MIKRDLHKILMILIIGMLISCNKKQEQAMDELVFENFETSAAILQNMLGKIEGTGLNPRTFQDGEVKLVEAKDWTSGFFPGNLWFMYEYTRDTKWKDAAHQYSMNIESEKTNDQTHDMGFKLNSSFGNGYRLTMDHTYKAILMEGARTLTKRFNPTVGCIRSWNHNSDKWEFPVIIDNMMNLELLFWAYRETRDSLFYKIAVSHAEKTMENHFRNDMGTYHVVSFDTITGKAVKKNTHQGYADESVWARGQAWALYGYVMVYRETGDARFLDQAIGVANYILNSPTLPDDQIPYWDFNAPGIPDEPRDASAASVICSALYELSFYCSEELNKTYFEAADKILLSLSSIAYLSTKNNDSYYILNHSVGSKPGFHEVDVPLIYADYYFLEANLRRYKIAGNWGARKADIIIKADDLSFSKGESAKERWQDFADIAINENVKVSPGIVGIAIQEGDEDFIEWIRKYNKTGLFEFWNHGQYHKRTTKNGERASEFYNQSVETQMAFLNESQSLAQDRLGFPFTTFGAPYNWCDENTATAIAAVPEINVWLYPPKNAEADIIKIFRVPPLNIEYPVHKANFYHFFNNYYFYSNMDVIAIQGHPMSWDSNLMSQYALIIKYLKNIDVQLIHPRDIMQSSNM